jgi:hypothetical protein
MTSSVPKLQLMKLFNKRACLQALEHLWPPHSCGGEDLQQHRCPVRGEFVQAPAVGPCDARKLLHSALPNMIKCVYASDG